MIWLRALFYADGRAFINGLRQIRRSPGRAVGWILYTLVIALFIVSRVLANHFRPAVNNTAQADYIVCGFLVIFFLYLAFGIGAIGLFRSRAEAHFIVGSPVPPHIAIPYLQIRDAVTQSWMSLFRGIYFLLIFAPWNIPVAQAANNIALVLASFIALISIGVPRRLASRPYAILTMAVCLPLALVCALPAIRTAVFQVHLSPVAMSLAYRYIPAWHPGSVLEHPSWAWVLLALGVAAAAIGVLVLRTRNAYPEVYALSMRRLEVMERFRARRRGAAVAPKRVYTSARSPKAYHAPAGLAIFVWKASIEIRRQMSPSALIVIPIICAVAGFALSHFSQSNVGFYSLLINFSVVGTFVFSVRGAMGLSAELRRPLFWLARATLLQRLAAVCGGRLLLPLVNAAAFVLGIALAGGDANRLLIVGIGAPAYIILQVGIGTAVFAISPRMLDQRGPLSGLRILLALLFLLPPGVTYGLGAWQMHSLLAGILAAALVALAETAVLLVFAASLLAGRADRLSAA